MGRGSAGNVIAGLASFFIPGLGQLLQGRLLLAGFMFVMTWLLWLLLLGWVRHRYVGNISPVEFGERTVWA